MLARENVQVEEKLRYWSSDKIRAGRAISDLAQVSTTVWTHVDCGWERNAQRNGTRDSTKDVTLETYKKAEGYISIKSFPRVDHGLSWPLDGTSHFPEDAVVELVDFQISRL